MRKQARKCPRSLSLWGQQQADWLSRYHRPDRLPAPGLLCCLNFGYADIARVLMFFLSPSSHHQFSKPILPVV